MADLSQSVWNQSLRRRTYFSSAGILTYFPFGALQLGCVLGPTNPQPMIVAEEPGPLRWLGFSPSFAVTTERILIPAGSTQAYAYASAPAEHLPIETLSGLKVSVANLVPSIFRAFNLGG